VLQNFALLGDPADFKSPVKGAEPAWEHTLFLDDPACQRITIKPSTSGFWKTLNNRHVDPGQLYRLAADLRAASTILAQSEQSGYQAALCLAATQSKRRLFMIFHGHNWWTRRNRMLNAISGLSKSVHFLCLSQALGDILVTRCGVAPARVHVTGFGVDAEFFQPAGPVSSPTILSAGTASRDYRSLINAVEGLSVPVKIAADSNWYKEPLNFDMASKPANVDIFSAGNYVGLRQIYSEASFVVVPLLDVDYACGYAVIAEAMAMGKAVIATRTGAPSDLIEDGVSGLYVPPGDVVALREAIARLLADPAATHRMGAAGRARVESEFNLQAYVARLRTAMALSPTP
jgi:glycosyltransferase involved in cell wall biosynthesis